jgi:hypothetical protein
MWRIIPSISVALLLKYRKTAAESLETKYHLETATLHKLDNDSGRIKDSGARLTYELRNYVTTLASAFATNVLHCTANKFLKHRYRYYIFGTRAFWFRDTTI